MEGTENTEQDSTRSFEVTEDFLIPCLRVSVLILSRDLRYLRAKHSLS